MRLVKDGAEQATLALIRELRKAGVSLRKIVERLNKVEAPARGERWHLTSIVRLLRRAG